MQTSEVIVGNSMLGCGSAKEQLCYPTQLSITPDNILYILDSGNRRIQRYNLSDRTVSTAVDHRFILSPLRLHVTETHDIYVLDRPAKTNSFVKVWYNNNYNKNGTVLVHAYEKFRSFHVDRDSNIYILTDNAIRKWFAPNYYYFIEIAAPVNNGAPFYVDEQLSLYVHNIPQRTIEKWPTGSSSSVTVVSGLPYVTNSDQLVLTMDCNKYIYLTHMRTIDHMSSYIIYRFNPQKNTTDIIDRNLTSVAGFQFDSEGNFYVTERSKHHVKVFAIMN